MSGRIANFPVTLYLTIPWRKTLSKKNALADTIQVTKTITSSHPPASVKLASTILKACVDSKGIDLTLLDVSKAFGLSDYFIVVSGRSDRHVQGLVNRVINSLSENGEEPIGVEGFENGHWVIVDCGDVVLHAFYEPVRETYDIEGLWADATKIEVKENQGFPDRGLRAA